jgi:hypothetical protein
MVLFWVGRLAASQTSGVDPISSSQLDYKPLYTYIGIALLTLSWTDTGVVPQYLFYQITPYHCKEMSPVCTYCMGLIQYGMGVLILPVAAAFCLEATWPYYQDLYDWVQVSFHLSMALLTCSVLPPLLQESHPPSTKRLPLLALAIGIPVIFLFVGTSLLAIFYFTPECPERLCAC